MVDPKFGKPYDPSATEPRIYEAWEKSGYFNPDSLPNGKDKTPYTIIMPPPNATGILHMGHALMLTLEDILIRWKRMQGYAALWLPGTDHAAIATQSRVEKDIQKAEGKNRHELGREEFLRRAQVFVEESRDTIRRQVRVMGASCDWSREAFTLDEQRNRAVRELFKRMYDAGLIYRGHRIVNWDPKGQTTISDDEIVYEERKEKFYYLKYGPFVIGTARPETKFGDKHVVMHPDDARYAAFAHGQKIELEWINGPITATVIKDEAVDMEFGTGVMTITPWHDVTDFEIAERHGLEKEQIIDERAKLLPIAGEFAGMKIAEAREKIVEKLRAKGLVEREEDYTHNVATAERTGGVIEPQIKLQWFVSVNKAFPIDHSAIPGIASGSMTTLTNILRAAVEAGGITIVPEHFTKTYFHWIDNLRDWCISRQIWYGHRVPVWYCTSLSALPKMGFHEEIVHQLRTGKTKTYRLRDQGVAVGDAVRFENTQSGETIGYGVITRFERMQVKDIDYRDTKHFVTYDSLEELIKAFEYRNPEKGPVTPERETFLYEYEFHPLEETVDGCGNSIMVGEKPDGCPSCGSPLMLQDGDTLDTWFSSGAWSFSTLGWPTMTDDLRRFHPTNVLETGYDILFFWIARMILMSGFALGQVPFRTVYLHGIVRDVQGRKFSKSLGNGIDPIEMANKFGADASRMALIVGNTPGTDFRLSEDKIKAYKLFANKLWNIARFILENTNSSDRGAELTEVDAALRAELDEVAADVTKDLEAYRIYLAGEKLYHYAWHRLADVILEESKPILQGSDERMKRSRSALLRMLLDTTLRLLHPFMPFITEEIWASLDTGELLMVTAWPFDTHYA